MVKKNIIDELFDSAVIKNFTDEIFSSRKNIGDDQYTYDELERTAKGKTYILKPIHIPIKEATDRAKSNCKDCHGTGRKVISFPKDRIANPMDYVILSDTPTNNLSDAEMKELVEIEKNKKFWKVVLPCRCTLVNMIKAGEFILSNSDQNILIRVECVEKVGE